MKVKFPWTQLEAGQGFFVPCLDLEKVRALGLRAAIPYRINAQAAPGIRGGKVGVWFYIKPRSSAASSSTGSPAA
jgi:hypothetical protein